MGVRSCTVGYAVAQLDMQLHSWICSYTVFYYLGTQLHADASIQYCAYCEISATAYLFVQLHIMTL